MKRLSKAILIALCVIAALVVVAVFAVNLYVQSPGVQALIQEEISRALRVPLRITNTSVNPWGDLRITGISIPNGGSNLLEATAFRARYRLLPLLRGRLVIEGMSVENPQIVWPQNAEGKWTLPRAEQAAAQSAAVPPATAAKTTKPPASSEVKKDVAKKKTRGLQVTVDGLEIRHGSVALLDEKNQPIAKFADVNMTYTLLTAERVEGTATIGSITWGPGLVFEAVRTAFAYTPQALELPELTATLAGGPVAGNFKVRHAEAKSPFELGLRFDQIDMAKVATAMKWGEGQAAGTAGGRLELAGTFAQFARSEGQLHVTLHEGRFREFAYFEMIGQALQLKQLSDFRLNESSATARIADAKLHFENITLNAADLKLEAKGVARFDDGKLQFSARLSAPEALIKQLPSLVRDNFEPADQSMRAIDFNVTGKASKPKTDLLDKVVGRKLEDQFGELVGNLFGRKKKDDKKEDDRKEEKKKKKKEEPETPPIEPATTAPAPASPGPAATSNPAPVPPQ